MFAFDSVDEGDWVYLNVAAAAAAETGFTNHLTIFLRSFHAI